VVRALVEALPNRSGFEVSHVGDVHPPKTTDPDWLRTFADEGGTAIVSGDFRITTNWVDLVAYTETGLISFFPPTVFERFDRFGKVAFLVRWWPAIVEKIKSSQQGDRWRLGSTWEPCHTKMQLLRDPRVKGRKVVATRGEILKLERKRTSE
jgi:hypothetical protein